MIRRQKLWAGCGLGSSLAEEKSAWQPLPASWLGRESWEVRGSGRAVGDLCLCDSLLCSMLTALFSKEMKHNRCAEYAWLSSGEVTSVSFLERGAARLLLGYSCPSQGCHIPSLLPCTDLGCFMSAGGEGHAHAAAPVLSWLQPVLAFTSAVLCSCWGEIPAEFLVFRGFAPTQGFRRGARAEQGEPCHGSCISLLQTLGTLCARDCFGTVAAHAVEAADATLTCRHPRKLGAVVRLPGALPCSSVVLSSKHLWPGWSLLHGASWPPSAVHGGVSSLSPPHEAQPTSSWAGRRLVVINAPICCQHQFAACLWLCPGGKVTLSPALGSALVLNEAGTERQSIKLSSAGSAIPDVFVEHCLPESPGFPGLGSGNLRDILLSGMVPGPCQGFKLFPHLGLLP